MSNHIVKQATVLTLVVLVSFFALPALSLQIESHILFSLGVILGGLICIFMPSGESTDSLSEKEADLVNAKTLYVGNLPYRTSEAEVKEVFSAFGKVLTVRLVRDRNTGKKKGFGFVEMEENGADDAIAKLNDTEFQQRTLKVREARTRATRDGD
ncbi:RNA recognition motif domain-containing protein [Gayadomonas joobiniege]|uniref:RNA recognition motif domain-containing protein n=1 Tax=Gayadomonas joobiniege TaxID=1234606 RepID=UPI00036D6534|nr:RNA-binding protein [Gayadomonas joobiniege]